MTFEERVEQIRRALLAPHAVPSVVLGRMPRCRWCGTKWITYTTNDLRSQIGPACPCHLRKTL